MKRWDLWCDTGSMRWYGLQMNKTSNSKNFSTDATD